ncbi:MAG: T9SS type A sorting domain-containing protein [Saprospiraceae bacterium]|nr:T9SS type A sorting domain-containing protein [Saprospiraceae bacterium]
MNRYLLLFFGIGLSLSTWAQSPNVPANCQDLNLSVGADGTASFMTFDFLTNAALTAGEITITRSFGEIIYGPAPSSNAIPIVISACPYLREELKLTITNQAGSCWSKLTFKQSNGPVIEGRAKDVYCFDSLVAGGHIDNVPPQAMIPCRPPVPATFVADWPRLVECGTGNDTLKVIYREYEAFDKDGNRGTTFDTITVFRLPELIPGVNAYCAEKDTSYCGVGNAGPYMVYEERCIPGMAGMDQDGDGVPCDTLYFLVYDDSLNRYVTNPLLADTKCGLIPHLDYWSFGNDGCSQQSKYILEIKQVCTPIVNTICTVPGSPPNAFTALSPGYISCEFWMVDLDTVPPLFAPKVFGEFPCLTIDTNIIGGSDLGFLDIFQPVVYTNEHDCAAYTYLPPLCIFDDWSGVKSAKATVEGGGTFLLENEGEKCFLLGLGDDGETIVLEDFLSLFGGELDDFVNDTILQIIDSLGLLEEGSCYRSHEKVKLYKSDRPTRIFYEVYDSCHLIARDTAYIHVKDNTKPVAVADKGVTVSLSDKKAWVDAEVFDEGSWDNCGLNMILARRADWKESCVDLCYNNGDEDGPDSIESSLCWLWTNGHDTLWTLDLEQDKHADEVEAHYQKQLDWFCEDETNCGRLLYNSWQYDLIKYATTVCKSNGYLDDHGFEELFLRAVGNPQQGDKVRVKNEDFRTLIDTALGGVLADSLFTEERIIELDTNSGFSISYGVDVFKCQQFNSLACGDIGDNFEDLFIQVLLQVFLENCFPFFGPSNSDIDLFIPAIFPEDFQTELFASWKSIGGGWSDAVPFSCEDACGPVTVEILVMDYWCNWSKAWTNVWVEDKTPVKVEKDVVAEEQITCKTYKDARYDFPGEDHPVSIEYIIARSKSGDSTALAQLDYIFGGYEKAWRDPYNNYVDIDGHLIECDIPFYDSVCDCTTDIKPVRVYDDHLGYIWKDSLITECFYDQDTIDFQKGIVVVNCADNVYCEQEVWCDFDHCGQGYIYRKWKIWQGCPPSFYEDKSIPDSLKHPVDTITRHQRIWVGNECELDKYMFDAPGDVTVYSCGIKYDPVGSGQIVGLAGPDYTGYATYKFDDDCRIVGIAHDDKVFKVVGGEEACYKIVRTWYFADWCGTGGVPAQDNWWYEREFVVDSCVQKIIVVDTVAPVCIITGPVEDGASIEIGGCSYDLNVKVDASDACGINKYYWELKDLTDGKEPTVADSGDGELNMDTVDNFTISSQDLYPGYYVLKVQVQDDCSNESFCEYHIQLESGKKPAPVCVSSVTARLTPWDTNQDGEVDSAHAVVWAEEFNSSSVLACDDDSIAYRLEFINLVGDSTYVDDGDSLALGCDDIGTHLVRLWVLSYPSGTADFCDVVLIVQSDFSGCGTNVGTASDGSVQQIGMNTEQQDQPNARSMSGDASNVRIPADAGYTQVYGLDSYQLGQNRPNPFKEETIVDFTLPATMRATITVYDVTGRALRKVTGQFAEGANSIVFKKAEIGADGILYYQLQAGEFVATRKMLLIK